MSRRNRNMCVRIAKDVLKQLRLKRYVATPGTYVNLNNIGFTSNDESFKKLFKTDKEVTCEVCALGSAFVSLVNIANKCSVGEMEEAYDNGMFERLSKHFGVNNVALMESAFECRAMNSFGTDDMAYEVLELAAEWGRRFDDPTKRLRAIMQNVIRNNGDFKLPKKLVAQYA